MKSRKRLAAEWNTRFFFQASTWPVVRSGDNGMKRSVDWQLSALGTDYVDFGFLHCIDEEADLDVVLKSGVLEYIQKLQKEGTVRHIGLSSHTPRLVNRVLDMGVIDLVMFSINPGYDYRHGDYAIGSVDERAALYRRCEAEGVGISVMKAFSGGQLLNAGTSPFGKALTEYQCIQYALDKPGVLTVLPGIRNCGDLRRILGFLEATAEEKDYSVLGSFAPQDAAGKCVYCNHCQPCPAGLDVGLINKYYDLAKAGISWPAATMKSWRKKPAIVLGAATATAAARSMWRSLAGWLKYRHILGCKQ